jgi:hypothetical protein
LKKQVLAGGLGDWVRREGKGVKGDPYRYYLIGSRDEFTSSNSNKSSCGVEPLELLHSALFGNTTN